MAVFERFTERARQVVVLAQDEARALRHNYIGTEHLLLGLLREQEGIVTRVLGALGIELEAVRAQVREIVGEGDESRTGEQRRRVEDPARRRCGRRPYSQRGRDAARRRKA